VSELLDDTFYLYRRNFQVVACVAVLVALPRLILSLASGAYLASFNLLQRAISSVNDPAALQGLMGAGNVPNSPFYLFASLLQLLLIPFSAGALYQAAVELAAHRPASIGSVLVGTLRRYLGLLGLMLLVVLFLLTGLLVVTLPLVIWVVVRWILSTPVLFAEGVGPVRALARSWQLVKGEWWRTLGILLLVVIMVDLIQIVLGFFVGGVAAFLPGVDATVRAAVSTTLAGVVAALAGPLLPITLTLLYFDMRVRKEGYDLEELARQAAKETAPA